MIPCRFTSRSLYNSENLNVVTVSRYIYLIKQGRFEYHKVHTEVCIKDAVSSDISHTKK